MFGVLLVVLNVGFVLACLGFIGACIVQPRREWLVQLVTRPRSWECDSAYSKSGVYLLLSAVGTPHQSHTLGWVSFEQSLVAVHGPRGSTQQPV